jgi:hypothetical protein
MRRPDLIFSLTCVFAAAAEETLQGGPVASKLVCDRDKKFRIRLTKPEQP